MAATVVQRAPYGVLCRSRFWDSRYFITVPDLTDDPPATADDFPQKWETKFERSSARPQGGEWQQVALSIRPMDSLARPRLHPPVYPQKTGAVGGADRGAR